MSGLEGFSWDYDIDLSVYGQQQQQQNHSAWLAQNNLDWRADAVKYFWKFASYLDSFCSVWSRFEAFFSAEVSAQVWKGVDSG